MSQALLTKYTEERSGLAEIVENVLGRADAEQRDLVPAEIEQLEATKARMVEIDAQVAVIKDTLERRNSSVDVQHLMARAESRRDHVQVVNEPTASLGRSFVESDAFRAWDGSGRSGKATIDLGVDMLTRAPLQTGADPGQVMLPAAQKFMTPQPAAPTPLLNAVGRLSVSTNSVDLVVYGDPKGATGAAVVPELGNKPEGALAASQKPVSIDTIAYWVQASRQLLQDAPAVSSLIDSQLRLGLLHKLEAEVTATIAGEAFDKTTGGAGQPLIEVARMGMATIQEKGFTPNALLCNPMDAAAFDIYLMQNTMAGAALGQGVFGLQIIPVSGLSKPLLGDFRTAVWLLERTGTDVFISDSHGSTFTQNILTILAELRAKSVVVQPDAVTELEVKPAK